MKFKFFMLFLSLFLAGVSGAEPNDAETIKAIEAASKDFQDRIIAMYPPSGEYSTLRELDSYAMEQLDLMIREAERNSKQPYVDPEDDED